MANRDFKVRHGLNVCGNSSLGGNVAISGNLDVGGNLSLDGADLGGALQVSGSASLGSLKVAGMTSLDGGLKVKGTMCVVPTIHAGNISASGQLQVDGTTSLKSSLTVSGMTSLQGGLVVDTSMDVQTTLNANTISASGNLKVDGTTSLNGALTVSGTASFKGDLSISGSLQIGGAGGSGVGIATDVTLGSTLTVSGSTDLNDDLQVAGNASIAGTTTLSGNVQAKGQLSVGGDLIVSGALQVGGSGGSDFSVDSPATFADTLTVSGMTSLQGGLVVDTSMNVQASMQANDISSSGTLFIGGSTNPHIELSSNTSGTPYIDFGRQVGGQGQDYGGRIILDGDTTLSICAQQLHLGAQNICLDGTVRATGDVCMQTVGYANQGFRAGLNAGAVGQYDTILVGERRGAGGTGDGYASITMSPGSFGSKMDSTTSFWSVWTNKNSVQAERIKVSFGTSTETIALRPRGQDTLVAGSTSAGSQYVNVAGDLQVSGSTSLGSLKVAGTTCLQAAVDINQTLAVSGTISAPGGIHAVAGNIQTTGVISGSQLRFVSSAGQRMTVSNLDSVSGRVGTLSATKFNWTSAGGQRITISSATITSLNVSTITVNQQGNIARRISGTVASENSSYVTAFTVNGNNNASCVEVFFEGSIANVVVSCYAEIVVNHSGDITIRTHQGQYTPLDIQVISNNNEDFAVLVKRNGGVAGTANLSFNVYPKGDETVTATSTNPYSGTTFTHTGVRGTKITATGGNTHRFETDGEIIGKQTLTVSGLTSLQGGVVIDTSMQVQTKLHADAISASGQLQVDGTASLKDDLFVSGNSDLNGTLTVSGNTTICGKLTVPTGASTIAAATFDNGWFKIGNSTTGIAMDNNEIYFANEGNLGTLAGNLNLNPTGVIATGKDFDSTARIQTTNVISGTTIRCSTLCAASKIDINGTFNVCGTTTLSGSLKVSGGTCLNGGLGVQGGIALTGELDFNGATHKYMDFMLVSSNAATFNANFRSMDHNGQNHHTHLTLVRGGAVQLAYNNNTKAATTNTGFYVSGILSATQDVKVAGQLRAAGDVSVDGGGHIANQFQVGQQISVGGGIRAAQTICAGSHIIAGDSAAGRIGLSLNDGYGNANITFNHHGGLPDVTGNAARIETNVDSTTSSFITLEVGSGVQAGVSGGLQTAATFYANRTEINGELQALGNTSLKGTLLVSGTASFKGALNVSGTLSARKYSFEPYGVVPAYNNSNYGTITYNSAESAIELSSGSDTTIGMAFPAWKVNVNPGNKWQITMQIRASAATTNGVFIRVYEYDAELPAGKIAVSNDATNALVQEDTRHNTTGQYENQPGSTDWQTITIEYTPTSTAVWASIVILNWSGLGTNALYVREPQINEILESINIGSNIQVTGHVSADGYGHFGQSLQVSGTISTTLLTAGTVRGNQVCAQQQLITNQQMITRGNLYVSGGSVLSGTVSFKNANGHTHWQGTADRRSALWRNDGSNYYLLITGQQQNANVSWNTWRPFYVNLSSGATHIGTRLNTATVSSSAQLIAAQDVFAGGQLRATGRVSVDGDGHIGANLQVGGTACINALRVDGVLSAQGGLVIDTSFDCQIGASFNNISASGALRVDGQISSQGSILAGQTLRAGGNLCGQGNGFITQNFKVGGTTCLQSTTVINGALQIRSELDFIGPTNKYLDFYLVSSNGTQFSTEFRSVSSNSEGFQTHLKFTRSGSTELMYSGGKKASTKSTGFFVSGQVCATQDVKAGGQLRAAGALSCDGSAHVAQSMQVGGSLSLGGSFNTAGNLQVTGNICCAGIICGHGNLNVSGNGQFGGTVSCTALHATGGNIQTTGAVSGNQVLGQVGDFVQRVEAATVSVGTVVTSNNTAQYDKLRVWNNWPYSIGMMNAMTHGYLNDYAMTFTFNNDADRGFVFRHDAMSKAQAAIAFNISGRTSIAHGLRVGYGVAYQGDPGTTGVTAAGDVYAGGQLRAANGVSVNGGGHIANNLQVGGTVSCTALHATGGNIQTTGVISGNKLVAGVCTDFIKNSTGGQHFLCRSTVSNVSGVYTRMRIKRRGRTQDFFVQYNSDSNQTEFRVRTDGRVCADQQFNSGGADFAEYFEWADGNPNVSDRIGRSVVVTGTSGKIGIATTGQTPFGVVTGIAAFVGDSAGMRWKQKYATDDYGRVLRTEDGTRIANPDYNSACTYTPRSERPEWDTIGMMGKVPVRVGEVINPNWMKLRVLTPTVEEYLVR